MQYTRVYSDLDGVSHFDNVKVGFSSVDFAPPAPPLNISEFNTAVQYGFLMAPAGWAGDWHPAPQRQVLIYLSGEIEAEVGDGEIRCFAPGSVTLVEDVTGRGHRSRVLGDKDVLAIVIQLEE